MKYYVTFLILVVFSLNAQSQIVDQIKDASDRHTDTKDSSNSGSDDSYYDDSDDDDSYYNDDNNYDDYSYYAEPWSNADPILWLEKKRADSNYKFAAINLLYRQTTSSGQVSFFVPEVQIKLAAFYSSIRVTSLIEERVTKEDQYQTVDLQLFGFQTNPKGTLVYNMSAGLVGEQYSGKTFVEGVIGFRLQPTKRLALAWEGRLAGDEFVRMRSENNFIASYAVLKNNDLAIEASVFGTNATYYEEVRVKGFGFGLGLRF